MAFRTATDRYNSLLGDSDPICALSTASGTGAIAVLRVSGEGTKGILQGVFQPSSRGGHPLEPRRMEHGWLVEDGNQIDEVMVCLFHGPHSYTGEDLCEIHCHGNPHLVQRVLGLLIAKGARLAEPGEFTFRALRNGRMDLEQAEAVNDLITARTRVAQELAVRNLQGELSRVLDGIRERLTDLLVRTETELEFEFDDTGAEGVPHLLAGLPDLVVRAEMLAESGRKQKSHARGIPTVLCGRPNVGKSTLFNRLLARDRALVTPIPGTTRDTLEEVVELSGMPFLLIDTAGLRHSGDEVERLGMERTLEAASRADLVIVVNDLTRGCTREDQELMARLAEASPRAGRILLANKRDLLPEAEVRSRTEDLRSMLGVETVFPISAMTGEGMNELTRFLEGWVEREDPLGAGERVLINLRQAGHFETMAGLLRSALEGIRGGRGLDLIADDLHLALRELDRLEGKAGEEGILGEVFSRFCIGK